jgi:hypothetical protein
MRWLSRIRSVTRCSVPLKDFRALAVPGTRNEPELPDVPTSCASDEKQSSEVRIWPQECRQRSPGIVWRWTCAMAAFTVRNGSIRTCDPTTSESRDNPPCLVTEVGCQQGFVERKTVTARAHRAISIGQTILGVDGRLAGAGFSSVGPAQLLLKNWSIWQASAISVPPPPKANHQFSLARIVPNAVCILIADFEAQKHVLDARAIFRTKPRNRITCAA